MELVAVGVVTTGLAACGGVLAFPRAMLSLRTTPETVNDLRVYALRVLAVFGSAILISVAAGLVVSRFRGSPAASLQTGVWWDVLQAQKIPSGKVAHVAVELADGYTVDGLLTSFTWSPDVGHRDIALSPPIKVTRKGEPIVPGYDALIVPGEQIRHIAVKYAPR